MLQRLYDEGARNFWIHNTGPLGCLPRIIAKFGKDPSKLNQFGCVISHNNVATAFNTQLHDFSVKFRGQFSEANVTLVDIFSIKSNLIANYSQFGKSSFWLSHSLVILDVMECKTKLIRISNFVFM